MWTLFAVVVLGFIVLAIFSARKELKKSGGFENYVRMRQEEKLANVSNLPPPLNIVAYRIYGDNNFNFDIVGEASYQGNLANIAGDKEQESKEHECIAIIKCEPSNSYDSNAVAVAIDRKLVGYFSRANAQKFQQFLRDKHLSNTTIFAVNALIVGGWSDDHSTGSFGVKLDMPKNFNKWNLE